MTRFARASLSRYSYGYGKRSGSRARRPPNPSGDVPMRPLRRDARVWMVCHEPPAPGSPADPVRTCAWST